MSNVKQVRLKQKLCEQLRFIQRSSEAFDEGSEDEALRLATALRVIFHDTTKSVSLVRHLNLRSTKMLSSSRGFGDWRDYLGYKLDLSSSRPVTMYALKDDRFHELSLTDWWSAEPIFTYQGQKHPRKKIVLSAANKDGGAHVDRKLESYYEFLCGGEYGLGIIGNLTYEGEAPFPQGVAVYADNAHLALIRQFAHEVLASSVYFGW